MKWTLEQGREYILTHRTKATALHYDLGIWGSVFYSGGSDKDLDIICFPVNGNAATPTAKTYQLFCRYIYGTPGELIEKSTHFWNHTMFKITKRIPDGRLVDWFIVFNNQ